MPESQGVATTRRRLRTELRRLRDAAGLHQSDVVKQLDWSISKLIRIENGSVGISVTDVRALAGIYHADPELIEELVKLARVTRERQWWSSFRHILTPSYREYIGYEADASAIYTVHPTAVPGLLQVDDYIRAINASTALEQNSAERAAAQFEVRRRRQKEILFSDDPPQYHVILDEAGLRRQVGGVKVMRTQLEHLVGLRHERVNLGVLPFHVGGHVGMQGAFTVMEFASDAEAGVLFFESASGLPIQREQDQVNKYRAAFDQLFHRALVGDEARAFIRRIADELDQAGHA
jgi:transcriptional regulator with XRE-family HTH domain